ncbi:MAG: GDP-fucose synthetase [Candidatus Omnitrophica bacterium CG11_big_fil_rev_8_21_14_0_20_43_6]|nr:MAG: GDP-fucose synthetase [Candidatus Omnitrophica bacterium CG11_big_fil_rev_8_21_14_0_20_43_6]
MVRTHKELELTEPIRVNEFFQKERPEYVFLAAGLTGGISASRNYPATFMSVNIAIQNTVFSAAHESGVKKLIFYGSSCMYPRECPQPIKEESLLTGELEKTSDAYAIAKISGLMACQAYNRQYNKNVFMALVPNSIYGPNDNFDPATSHVLSGLVGKFHDAKMQKLNKLTLWGSGAPRREFVFSEDVAEASIFAVNHAEKILNTHYNLGTGYDLSIKELAEIVARVVGFNGKIDWDTTKPDGVFRKLLDSAKFISLGWKPRVELEEGIKITYDWFLNNAAKKD